MSKLWSLKALAVAAGGALLAGAAWAQQVTLRVHLFLPAQAFIAKMAIETWGKKIESDSGGRFRVQVFPSMQL
ncbi:MAG: C4-dicarboxylate ABC transporter, partial [Tepidimonas sp.]|nr:C4-dicarboxylate ABC transporter [Tepidimonas sp.]